MLLEAALGPKIFQANSSRLIDLGYLVAPSIRFVATPKPPGRRLHAEYAEIYRRFVVENEERNRLIAEEANRLIDRGKSALCLVKEIRHGEALAALIPRACFIHGSMDARKRAKALNDLAAKKCLCLIATALADEGLDVPTLDAVILAGGGRSETKALQRIGRALRPAEGKAEAEIIDFYDQVPYLEEHAKKRLEIYRSEPRFKVDARAVAI
ncbi:MAG: UvrABC system protein B [candidate division BRC1 bacterium ADurb.BinA364]|nr:MAG: UvrABC system protein B [candidate division BRC1 bacterium ADurb.BinA364]